MAYKTVLQIIIAPMQIKKEEQLKNCMSKKKSMVERGKVCLSMKIPPKISISIFME